MLLGKIRGHILLILFSGYHLLLTLIGFAYYPGSLSYFAAFSISFYVLVVWNTRAKSSPGILFLSIMIWLGFFQKIVFHLFTNFEYMNELIGQFKGTRDQWDQVLLIATLAALGIVCTTILFNRFKFVENFFVFVPNKYVKIFSSKSILLAASIFILFIFFVALMNVILGIMLVGLVAMTILPWPLNPLVAWLLSLGFAIAWTFLIDYEFTIKKNLTKSFIFCVVGAFICSVSIISRGLFVFQILPILFLLYRNQAQFYISNRALTGFTALFLILFVANTSGVTALRSYFYDVNFSSTEWTQKDWLNAQNQQLSLNQTEGEFAKLFTVFKNKAALKEVAGLVVNRWIGAEGAMAVVAYPEKGFHLIKQTLARVPVAGEFDLYEKIVNTQYTHSTKFSFTNIPGPVAFFFYSGSFACVFFGFIIFSILLYVLDVAVWSLFKNPFLSVLIGFSFANNVVQFGINPKSLLISLLMTGIGLFVAKIFFIFIKHKKFRSKLT